MSEVIIDITALANDILSSFKESIGEAWEKLTKEDLDIIKAAAIDAAKLHYESMSDPSADLETEIKIVNATLANMSIAIYLPIKKVFWASVQRAATFALQVLTKAATAALLAL
jgi:hypothetical protein